MCGCVGLASTLASLWPRSEATLTLCAALQVCIAGHTPNGKADVAGAAEIDPSLGVSYGRELAEKGVLTICPDNAGMGAPRDWICA